MADWDDEHCSMPAGRHALQRFSKRLDRAVPDVRTTGAEGGRKYVPRQQFFPFHARTQRFACIVTHRRAGKTVACIHELQGCALRCQNIRPRFAYVSPFLKQSKTVAWDYLREAVSFSRAG